MYPRDGREKICGKNRMTTKKNRERERREMRKKEWNVTKSGTSSSVFIKQGNSISRVISQLKRAREKGLHPKPNQKNCFSQSMFAQRLDSFYFLHCFPFLLPSFSACKPRPIGRKMGVLVYLRVDRETWRIWVIILVFTRVDMDLGDSLRRGWRSKIRQEWGKWIHRKELNWDNG